MPATPITKAVFPVAGLGTRFLPVTKANPKEMLPIVDKPLIQYAVEEAVEAGIKVMVFITGRNKRAIPDHFDKAYELEMELEAQGKDELLEIARSIIPSDVSCVYIRQPQALGLGHAVLCARPVVQNEPFAVLLADDLILSSGRGCLRQMMDVYHREGCAVLGTEEVPPSEVNRYGIVGGETQDGECVEVRTIVEKPDPGNAPSNLGVVGRYILPPEVFVKLASTETGAGGEIQLTDAIGALLAEQRVLAYRFEGIRFDCGSKLGYLQATVECGLRHEELGESFRAYLESIG